MLALLLCSASAFTLQPTAFTQPARAAVTTPLPAVARNAQSALVMQSGNPFSGLPNPFGGDKKDGEKKEDDEDKMTIEKIASFGIAGILSIAVAESVFWILSFPTSELLYFAGTGEWIDLTNQEGQLKFLAFTAGWGALGGVIAQYRTVLTAAAMTPWMDANVVKPYVNPQLERFGLLEKFGQKKAPSDEATSSD